MNGAWYNNGMPYDVVVIGGGAGGMIAAGHAAEKGAQVLLLEKMPQTGTKLRLTGQKRCNVSNSRPLDDFIRMFGPNGRLLYCAFSRFFRDDLLDLLTRYGVKTKTEQDGRIFPISDDARDVNKALEQYLSEHGAHIQMPAKVSGIRTEEGCVTGVYTQEGSIPTSAVILATGGATYASTGSSGDGYRIAEAIGHTIVPLRPALVPLTIKEIDIAQSLQGISLHNVRLTAFDCAKDKISPAMTPKRETGRGIEGKRPHPPIIESRKGDVLFTHFGLSGPATLLMSLAIVDALNNSTVSIAIDLLPELSEQQIHEMLQNEFDKFGKRSIQTILGDLLPHKMISPMLQLLKLTPDKIANQITAGERGKLVRLMKCLCFSVEGPLSMDTAMVTAGGVSLREIDPQMMASRLIKGLYFCGEVMDIDAETGGYNLQAAFSTGYIAGEQSAKYVLHK